MSRRSAFTLVEMLVVLGIIGVLAALLLPAAMGAVTKARNASIAIEVNQLATAIEAYKSEKGDYPPNCILLPGSLNTTTYAAYYNAQTFIQHVRRCYPKIAPSELNWFFTSPSGTLLTDAAGNPQFNPTRRLDEGEALVFWLSHTTTDPRYPFGLTNPPGSPVTFKKYYEFNESRLQNRDPANDPVHYSSESPHDPIIFQSYSAKYCKDSAYLYIDSRTYSYLTLNFPSATYRAGIPQFTSQPLFAYTEDSTNEELVVRPYWSNILTPAGQAAMASGTAIAPLDQYKPMNPTTFQILCSGQDGNFGWSEADDSPKLFPTGDYYNKADRDNITNFSGGKRLEDSVKQ